MHVASILRLAALAFFTLHVAYTWNPLSDAFTVHALRALWNTLPAVSLVDATSTLFSHYEWLVPSGVLLLLHVNSTLRHLVFTWH